MNNKGAIVIDTKLNDGGIKKGWESLKKDAKKLVQEYNKSVDALDKQSVALDRLKNKLDLMMSGNVIPPSVKAMESSFRKADKEAQKLKATLDQMEGEIEVKSTGLDMTKSMYGEGSSQYQKEKVELDALIEDNIKVAEKFEETRYKADNLAEAVAKVKLDPSASIEAQDLANRIALASQKTEETKEKTNSLKDKLGQLGKMSLNGITGSMSGVKKGFDSIGQKIDKFKTKMTRLIGTAMVFSLIRKGLSNLASDLGNLLNSNSQFASSLNQIKVNLMTAFAPIYNAVLPAINALMSALSAVTGAIASFIASIFGQTVGQAKDNAKALYGQAKAYEQVGKSAKEASGKLASFDNLEVNESTPDTSSSGGGGAPLNFEHNIEVDEGLLSFLNRLKDILATIANNIDFSNLSASLGNLWDSLKYLGSGVVGILKDFLNNFLVPLAKWTIEDLLPRFFNATAKAFKSIDFGKIREAFNGLWEALLPFAKNVGNGLFWFYENVLLPLGTWVINDIVPAFLGILSGAIDVLNTAISDLTPIFQWFWDNILSPIAEWTGGVIVDILNAVGDGLKWIADNEIAMIILESIALAIGLVTGAILAYNIAMGVCNVVTGVFSGIMAVLTSPITLVIAAIAALIAIVMLIIKYWDDLGAAAKACWDWIVGVFRGAGEWFKNTIIDPIVNFFKGMWEGLMNGAKGAWEGIKKVFSVVAEWFGNIFQKAWEGVRNVFSTGGKIFAGIVEGISNVFKNVVNAIISGINKVIAMPFDFINGILNTIRSIGFLGIEPFKGLWGHNPLPVPQIPKLAKGTVAYAPLVAQIGEYAGARSNPEIVSPESLMRQVVREEAGGSKEVVIENLTIISKIGEDTLRRQIIKGVRLEECATGKPLFVS